MSRQLGFADHAVVGERSRRKDQLSQIESLIDWSEISGLLHQLRSGKMDRPPYPALVLFKALLLQRWYGLSDDALEDALYDRLSFRQFVGLGMEEDIPDASPEFERNQTIGLSGDQLVTGWADVPRISYTLEEKQAAVI